MFKLTREILQKHSYPQSYTKGVSYYRAGRVSDLDVETERNSKDDYFTSIYATVEGSDEEYYEVEVNFSTSKGFTYYSCECPAFFSFNQGNKFCKHIIAVLLKYINEYLPKQELYNQSKSSLVPEMVQKKKGKPPAPPSIAGMLAKKMSSGFINYHETRREIILEPTFYFFTRYTNQIYLEFRTGLERLYVVKNLSEFLDAIFERYSTLEFGKGFTYDPAKHRFNDRDEKLLRILLELYETDKISKNNYYNSNLLIKGKQAIIPQPVAKRILELYLNEDILVSINGNDVKRMPLKVENLPLNFSLVLGKNGITLNLKDMLPLPLTDDGEYFFYQNSIYKPSEEQLRVYASLHNEMAGNGRDRLVFPLEDKDDIAAFILPALKKISNTVTVDPEFEKDIQEEPLLIKVYLDRYEKGIALQLLFNYGNVEINPLMQSELKKQDKLLVRDIEKETNTLYFIRTCGFLPQDDLFYLDTEEKIVDFIENGIPKLQEFAEVYYSDSFKTVQVYSKSNFKSKIRLNDELLEFTFSIEGVDRNELKNILESVRQKKKYHKLKNGGFIPLESDEIKDLSRMIEYLGIKDTELDKDKILLPKYQAVYIDQAIKSGKLSYIERDKRFRELVSNIREVQEADFEPPAHLANVLRGYQKIGFKWFKTLSSCGFGGILADEMGLGKTLQAISFIESEYSEAKNNKKPALVIAPTSLVYNWKSEIERFAPSLNAIVISGSKLERSVQRKEIESADVVITSYPLIRRDIDEYRNFEFSCCILDEAQQIKNPNSQNAKCVKEIKAKNRFALTGTPIENSLTELWSIFDFLMPGYLLSHTAFSKKYETPISKNRDSTALSELNRHIKPFILRRLKRDVIKELPPKIEQTIVVEMTDEQKKLYLAYLEAAKNEINSEVERAGFNKSRLKMIAALTRLRQICCDPSSFIENYEGDSGKLIALEELLEESISEGHRILLFSQFTSVLKNIMEMLVKNNIDFMYLDGQTKSEDRMRMVNRFNKGEGSVFLISLKAGGTGLNLSSADIVIHYDPWWNPAAQDQATDRAHRIGQNKTVEVIKLVARGTVEEKILKLQELKKDMAKNVIGDSSDEGTFISTLTQKELEELFTS